MTIYDTSTPDEDIANYSNRKAANAHMNDLNKGKSYKMYEICERSITIHDEYVPILRHKRNKK